MKRVCDSKSEKEQEIKDGAFCGKRHIQDQKNRKIEDWAFLRGGGGTSEASDVRNTKPHEASYSLTVAYISGTPDCQSAAKSKASILGKNVWNV